MEKELYSFKAAAEKIGYKPSTGEPYRQLYLLCKKMGIIDSKREPLAPHRYKGYFEVKTVTFPNNHKGNQTFITSKGLVYLDGLTFGVSNIGVRVMAERICSKNTKNKNTGKTPRSNKPGT